MGDFVYQSLYRKYRPKNLNDVIGQNVVKKIIINSIKKNKISHAYLFSGPRGTGKTSIAKVFAKTINCSNLQDYIPCENCENCISYNDKTNSDIIEIDAASNNGVDEIRELKNKVNIVPSIGKYKIYIIDEVHMLTIGAFNALLKTLEEPPQHVIFILATTELYKIPDTILSRCQRFDFEKISEKNIIEAIQNVCIKENVEIDSDACAEIARLSNGGLRDALSILEQVIMYADETVKLSDVQDVNGIIAEDEIFEFFNCVLKGNLKRVFELIILYDETGKNFLKLTDQIIDFIFNCIVSNKIDSAFSEKKKKLYDSINEICDEATLEKILSELNEKRESLKNSKNQKLNFELMMIAILKKKTDNSEERIDSKKMDNDNNSEKKEFMELVKIRINNTLAEFKKENYKNIKEKFKKIEKLLIDSEKSSLVSLVLDSELKAASERNYLFVYNNSSLRNIHLKKMFEIDNMISDFFEKKICTVPVTTDEWEKIKKEYNSKKKVYSYINENNEFNEKIKNSKNIIENTFENLVEYN